MIDVNSLAFTSKTLLEPSDYNQANTVECVFRDKFKNWLTIILDPAKDGGPVAIYLNADPNPLPEDSPDVQQLNSFLAAGNRLHETTGLLINPDLLDAMNGRIPNKVVKTAVVGVPGTTVIFMPMFDEYTGERTDCCIKTIGPEDVSLRFTCQSTGKNYDLEVIGNYEQVFKRPRNELEDTTELALEEAFTTGNIEVETQISRARADCER